MALDAATLALTAGELKQTLTDAKIAKIFEPTRDELVLTLRTRTETYALLLSARSGSARVCLTEESFENPETPPSFCMLMRKHLTGGRLLDVRMEPGDRIVYFTFQCTNEMGDLVQNILCAELMGRYSNLVLVQNGKIIDALKRVDFEDSDVRQLLPGLPYTIPPKPARPDFLQVSAASIVAAACERDLPVADALNKTVAGVGPVVCREAAWRAFDGEHLLANELDDVQKRKLMAAIDELKELHHNGGCPCSVTAPDGKPVEFTFFRSLQYGDTYIIKEWPSFNALLEMSSVQLMMRLIIAETGIPGNDIKSGRLTPEQWRHLESATKPLGAAPLYIDDTPALSVFEFRSKARRLKIHNDIQIIIIDYLQLMTGGTQDSKGNREQEVAFISRTLKAIAKELNVPIIALSQLSRATELRGGSKRPQLSDLRESGAIEQDADIVAFIHRPEYYGINQDENGMPTAGMAEIIIAKHRNGAVTDVNLRFLKDQARFADVDETLMPEAGSRPAPGQYEDVSSGSNSGLGGFGGVPEEFLTPGVSGAPVNLNEEEPF